MRIIGSKIQVLAATATAFVGLLYSGAAAAQPRTIGAATPPSNTRVGAPQSVRRPGAVEILGSPAQSCDDEPRCVRVSIERGKERYVLPQFRSRGGAVPFVPGADARLVYCEPPRAWKPHTPPGSCLNQGSATSFAMAGSKIRAPNRRPPPERVLEAVCKEWEQRRRLPMVLLWTDRDSFEKPDSVVAWSSRLDFYECR